MAVEQFMFTDWPSGKGVDPSATGLQIKACSEGLSTEVRWQLAGICMHHGQAFSITYAPRSAKDREQEWLAHTDTREVMPKEVLKEFPVIWSYDRLADNLFALTRVQYLGLTYDGRPGNFFAHALVFDPKDLASYDYNPLALRHSKLFHPNDPDENTTLPTLSNLGSPTDIKTEYSILRTAPYRDHLTKIVSALCTATPSARPVLLCLTDWCEAASLLEALLGLLPSSARCRTTFCTYESDRTWVVPTKAGRPSGIVAARHLFVLGGADNQAFNLRADEYKSIYAVFNFVENRFSDIEPPRRFAVFATENITAGRIDRLVGYHTVLERLGFEHDVDVWDTLVPAADLANIQIQSETIAEAARSLVAFATQPHQAQIALELLIPHIQAIVQTNASESLSAISTDLAMLADRLPEKDRKDTSQGFIFTIQEMAKKSLDKGHVRITTDLFKICGQVRDHSLLALFPYVLNELPKILANSSTLAEKEQLVTLLLESLRLTEKTPDTALSLDQLLVATFHAASEAGRIAEVWSSIGKTLLSRRLDGEWDAKKEELTYKILKYATADLSPEANLWLNLKLLKTTKLQGEKLQTLLVDSVYACSRYPGAADSLKDILRIAQDQFSKKDQHVIVLGRMAEAAYNTDSQERLFEAYRSAVKQIDTNQHNRIRRKLANADVVHILCHELLDEILPWSGEESLKKFRNWYDVVIKSAPPLMDSLSQNVARLLGETEQTESILPLAKELMSQKPDKSSGGSGLIVLYNTVVNMLPLEPLSEQWNRAFTSLPRGVSTETERRLQILKFLNDIQQQSKKTNWSTTEFPHTDPVWKQHVRLLSPAEKAKILDWCINTFATCGITTPEEAQGFVRLLDEVEESSADKIVNAVKQLLKGRDPVTDVLVTTAFTRCALEDDKPDEKWGKIVGGLLSEFDKNTRHLFESHLGNRFARRDQKYLARLDQFCNTTGLSLPKPTIPLTEIAEAVKAPSPSLSQQPNISGILDSAKRQWQKFLGGEKPPHKDQSGRKKKKGGK